MIQSITSELEREHKVLEGKAERIEVEYNHSIMIVIHMLNCFYFVQYFDEVVCGKPERSMEMEVSKEEEEIGMKR